MKFITYLEKISGVSVYPLVSLILFFVFFLMISYMVFKTSPEQMAEYENIPFNDTKKNY